MLWHLFFHFGSSCFLKGVEAPPSAWRHSSWSVHISYRADWLRGKQLCPTRPNRTSVEKKSDQISFPSCVSVEVGVIAKLEMQMFCFNLVNNPQMNCMLKHVDLFLTLKWDLVISLFSGMYGYLFPLLHKITFIMSLYLISKYSIFLFQSLIFFLVNIFSEQL